jgi:hypothetical protein
VLLVLGLLGKDQLRRTSTDLILTSTVQELPDVKLTLEPTGSLDVHVFLPNDTGGQGVYLRFNKAHRSERLCQRRQRIGDAPASMRSPSVSRLLGRGGRRRVRLRSKETGVHPERKLRISNRRPRSTMKRLQRKK